jgi:hypothetical protein
MKIWYLTKYALTDGEIKELADSDVDVDGAFLCWKPVGGMRQCFSLGKEVHSSRGAAIEVVISMAEKKIKSNKKSTAKMEALIKKMDKEDAGPRTEE